MSSLKKYTLLTPLLLVLFLVNPNRALAYEQEQTFKTQFFFSQKDSIPKKKLAFQKNTLSLFLGSDFQGLQSGSALYDLNEWGLGYRHKVDSTFFIGVELGSFARNFGESLNVSETQIERDENGILTGKWSTREEHFIGMRSLFLTLGAIKKVKRNIDVRTGLYLARNRSYTSTGNTFTTYNTFGSVAGATGDNRPSNKIKNLTYANNNNPFKKWDYGLSLNIAVRLKNVCLGVEYKQGLADMSQNSFFKNDIQNFSRYLGVRLGYSFLSF